MNLEDLPEVVVRNTYNWSPAFDESKRRENESKYYQQVKDFFTSLGFRVSVSSDMLLTASRGKLKVEFIYYESPRYVFKKCTYYIDGKKVPRYTFIKEI